MASTPPMRGSVRTVGMRDLRQRRRREERAIYSDLQLGCMRRRAGATRSAFHAGSDPPSAAAMRSSRASRPKAHISALHHVISCETIAFHARHVRAQRVNETGSRNAKMRARVSGAKESMPRSPCSSLCGPMGGLRSDRNECESGARKSASICIPSKRTRSSRTCRSLLVRRTKDAWRRGRRLHVQTY